MYKTAVYTLVNGGIQGPTHRKQQKSLKGDVVLFMILPRSPPWTDLYEILHRGSSRGLYQQWQILSQSGQGFRFCGGSNFWLSHRNEMSPLTHGLNYRSACDVLVCCVLLSRSWKALKARFRTPDWN